MAHALSQPVDVQELMDDIVANANLSAGVGISINRTHVILTGPTFEAMNQSAKDAEYAKIATVEASHVPTKVTKINLTTAPHVRRLHGDLAGVTGITELSVEFPSSYPGDICCRHNSVAPAVQTDLTTTAQAHDASAIPSLSIDTADQVIAADGVATGTVQVTDSRGASASGKMVKLKIPPGGDAAVDGDSFVLDASGQATATFQATTTFSGKLEFEFHYANDEADSVKFTVRRGTA